MQQEISGSEIAAVSPLHRSRSAERVLELLDTVVTNGELSLTAAAARTDMPASTALRHLRVLTDRGYLVKNASGSYSVGPAFVRTALASLQSGPYARLRAAAGPELERLVEATEESAYLAVRDGDAAVYIATVEGRRAIRHVGWVGRSVPIAGTAVGEALLAGALTPGARPTPIFNTGAIEPDVTAVCAPVHGNSGAIAALSVLGPADRLTGTRLQTAADAVIEAAVATSAAFSSVPPHQPSA
ncbi:IclR family transcriptional regulator [Candidatus Poriferisodalis sp.]|uniref:IclR family transcriptional regulator n=1 Tax=Candidatus Poriferisodalis sp. TaxID=3101277 RepID=UPI003B5AA53D